MTGCCLSGRRTDERVQREKAQIGVLQRVDRVVDVARDRLTAVEDIAISAKALYAQLAPAGKKP
jgi:hypothetical protein